VEAFRHVGRTVSFKNRLRSRILRVYISPWLRQRQRQWHEAMRRLTRQPHVVHAFLQLDDPYSYLLSRYLPALVEHYDVELRVHLVEGLREDFQPMPDMLAEYAVTDCARLARELGLPFLDKASVPPVEHRRGLLDALAANVGQADFGTEVFAALEIYWRGDTAAAARRSDMAEADAAAAMIAASQRLLAKLGHYNSAMLNYGGEWYWGIDRLHYLTGRLEGLGAVRSAGRSTHIASIRQVMHIDFPVTPPAAARELPPIELFYSFRSPYSQICLHRICKLADAYGIDLVLRPVLPLMMRNVTLPPPKIRYIIRDAMREAETYGVPFGNSMDPMGSGVNRCHAVFAYADTEKRGREFLLNASEMIWNGRIDAATDSGLRKITARTGLFWPEAKQALESDDWRETEAENRQLMMSMGSWGVPTICMGDYTVWGQDRLWLLARHIEELCDSGDGILA
jgi:2-hydroxychromene-2-carboxylate isomerase